MNYANAKLLVKVPVGEKEKFNKITKPYEDEFIWGYVDVYERDNMIILCGSDMEYDNEIEQAENLLKELKDICIPDSYLAYICTDFACMTKITVTESHELDETNTDLDDYGEDDNY